MFFHRASSPSLFKLSKMRITASIAMRSTLPTATRGSTSKDSKDSVPRLLHPVDGIESVMCQVDSPLDQRKRVSSAGEEEILETRLTTLVGRQLLLCGRGVGWRRFEWLSQWPLCQLCSSTQILFDICVRSCCSSRAYLPLVVPMRVLPSSWPSILRRSGCFNACRCAPGAD